MPRYIDPKSLVGKTITAVDNRAVNCWKLTFDDGTSVVLDTEGGPAGIPALIVFPYKPEDYGNAW